MLGNAMRKYVTGEKGKRYSKAVQNVYNYRIRKQALQALADLALLAKKLPEHRQHEIFNEKTLTPFIRNLFCLIPNEFKEEDADEPEDAEKPRIDKDQLAKRRERILALCHIALEEIGNEFNARNLAPDIMQVLTEAGPQDTFPTIRGLKAIYIKALHG